MHRIPALLIATWLVPACGPSKDSPHRRTAARRAAPAKCPQLRLSARLRKKTKLTRRIRKQACNLQPCLEAAGKALQKPGARLKLWVTIDQGGHVEGIKLSSRKLPEGMTLCIRKKILRWDFDIRDDSTTYGPFELRLSP